MVAVDSPVSNNGRGLKRVDAGRRAGGFQDSPVSNNGRGLKRRHGVVRGCRFQGIRPLAITGVD